MLKKQWTQNQMIFKLITLAWFIVSFSSLSSLFAEENSDSEPSKLQVAIEKSLPKIVHSSNVYIKKRDCFTCHHQSLPAMVFFLAQKKKMMFDEEPLKRQAKFTLDYFQKREPRLKKGNGVPGGPFSVGYALITLDLAGEQSNSTTKSLLEYLHETQKEDGSWRIRSVRPPLEESHFTATSTAIYGLINYGQQTKKKNKIIASAKKWLLSTEPKNNEDFTFKLLGLKWLDIDKDELKTSQEGFIKRQNEDGGWSQNKDLKSDPYATGQALYALSNSGFDKNDPSFQKGIRYLLDTQAEDGTWYVKSRSKPIQSYFDAEFPYEKDQFISIAASCWATLALLEAIE